MPAAIATVFVAPSTFRFRVAVDPMVMVEPSAFPVTDAAADAWLTVTV